MTIAQWVILGCASPFLLYFLAIAIVTWHHNTHFEAVTWPSTCHGSVVARSCVAGGMSYDEALRHLKRSGYFVSRTAYLEFRADGDL